MWLSRIGSRLPCRPPGWRRSGALRAVSTFRPVQPGSPGVKAPKLATYSGTLAGRHGRVSSMVAGPALLASGSGPWPRPPERAPAQPRMRRAKAVSGSRRNLVKPLRRGRPASAEWTILASAADQPARCVGDCASGRSLDAGMFGASVGRICVRRVPGVPAPPVSLLRPVLSHQAHAATELDRFDARQTHYDDSHRSVAARAPHRPDCGRNPESGRRPHASSRGAPALHSSVCGQPPRQQVHGGPGLRPARRVRGTSRRGKAPASSSARRSGSLPRPQAERGRTPPPACSG